MLRNVRLAFGMMALLALTTGEARAQYGWGGWGGGGGGTVQGDIARGAGYYNIGAGVFNEKTAVANSINTDTVMRWNNYLYLSQKEANRREYLRMARRQKRDSDSGKHVYERIRDTPEPHDIETGDALNVVLDQVTDPRIHSSALRLATTPLNAKTVREIPFENASEAVTISLHQLTAKDWPLVLRGAEFAADRTAYQQAIARALQEDVDDDGSIAPETLRQIDAVVARLHARLGSVPPAARDKEFAKAMSYVKALAGMSRMLRSPEIEKVLAELEKIDKTTLGSLLGFMHNYNLRFGPATTEGQRTVYRQLYPLMGEFRNRVIKESGVETDQVKETASNANGHPVDFFQGIHLDKFNGDGKVETPATRQP